MSDFFDEIKDNIDNFKSPAKQALQNLKDDINDSIEDRKENNGKDNNNKEKKGCLSKALPVIIVCLLIGFISNQCNSDDASKTTTNDTNNSETVSATDTESYTETTDIYIENLRYQIEYANQSQITLNRFPKQEKSLADWLEKVDSYNEIYLKIEKSLVKKYSKEWKLKTIIFTMVS